MAFFRVIVCFILFSSPLMAEDLRKLDNGQALRGWEAVGRLNLGQLGFCTASLIQDDMVLTAAHCLYDKTTGERLPDDGLEFLIGWRNGRADAYRKIRRSVVHPQYVYQDNGETDRVRYDIALLKLERPVRSNGIVPFKTMTAGNVGDEVSVVSYALDRSDAPSIQDVCDIEARQNGFFIMTCDIEFGSSGAPVFKFEFGQERIISVISKKARLGQKKVSLGVSISEALPTLEHEMAKGVSDSGISLTGAKSVSASTNQNDRSKSGAKFIKP